MLYRAYARNVSNVGNVRFLLSMWHMHFTQALGPRKLVSRRNVGTQMTFQSSQALWDKQTHNQRQAEIFDKKTRDFTASLPEDVKQACPPPLLFSS